MPCAFRLVVHDDTRRQWAAVAVEDPPGDDRTGVVDERDQRLVPGGRPDHAPRVLDPLHRDRRRHVVALGPVERGEHDAARELPLRRHHPVLRDDVVGGIGGGVSVHHPVEQERRLDPERRRARDGPRAHDPGRTEGRALRDAGGRVDDEGHGRLEGTVRVDVVLQDEALRPLEVQDDARALPGVRGATPVAVARTTLPSPRGRVTAMSTGPVVRGEEREVVGRGAGRGDEAEQRRVDRVAEREEDGGRHRGRRDRRADGEGPPPEAVRQHHVRRGPAPRGARHREGDEVGPGGEHLRPLPLVLERARRGRRCREGEADRPCQVEAGPRRAQDLVEARVEGRRAAPEVVAEVADGLEQRAARGSPAGRPRRGRAPSASRPSGRSARRPSAASPRARWRHSRPGPAPASRRGRRSEGGRPRTSAGRACPAREAPRARPPRS